MSLFLRNLKKANESSISFINYHCKVSRAMVFFFREGTKCAMGNSKIYEAIAKVQT